jgi:hypothetical protein
MTRRLLTLISLAVAILLTARPVTAPVNAEATATSGIQRTADADGRLNVRFGDGLFRLRVQSGQARMSVTIEIELPRFIRCGYDVRPESAPGNSALRCLKIHSRPGRLTAETLGSTRNPGSSHCC